MAAAGFGASLKCQLSPCTSSPRPSSPCPSTQALNFGWGTRRPLTFQAMNIYMISMFRFYV